MRSASVGGGIEERQDKSKSYLFSHENSSSSRRQELHFLIAKFISAGEMFLLTTSSTKILVGGVHVLHSDSCPKEYCESRHFIECNRKSAIKCQF